MDSWTAQQLVEQVSKLGGQIVIRNGQPKLSMPVDDKSRKLINDLKPMLTKYRGEIIAYCGGTPRTETGEHPGKHCDVCMATVYTDSPEIVNLCQNDNCPWWTPGCGFREERMLQLQNEAKEEENKKRRQQFAIKANQKKREQK